MPTVTVRLDENILTRLSALAQATNCSLSSLLSEAVRWYVNKYEWQKTAIENGIQEADAGNFATE